MKVEDLMSKELITIDANDSVRNALKLMQKHKISRLLVRKKGKIVGIVTERDLLKRLGSEKERKISDAHIYVSSCYSKNLIWVDKHASLKEVAKLMLENGISSLVVKDGDEIVGLITKTDVIKALKGCRERVERFMTKSVMRLQADARLLEARKLMLGRHIKRIPVVKGESLVGIITEQDIAKALGLFRKIAEGKQWDEKLRYLFVKDFMKTNVVTVSPSDEIRRCVELMLKNGISGLPVLENGNLVGIITKTDLLRVVVELF